jgi:hypothetical protein
MVAVVLLLVGAILVFIGKKNMDNLKGKPERAIKNAQDTMAAIRPGSDGHQPHS